MGLRLNLLLRCTVQKQKPRDGSREMAEGAAAA